jgi:hypothetical protein
MTQQVLTEKWNDVLESPRVESIKDDSKRRITAQLLENQESFLKEESNTSGTIPGGGAVGQNWDPILISMVRRMAPKLIAYDICGVQPMNQPTGLIFALRARYNNRVGGATNSFGQTVKSTGDEALHNEAKSGFSGNGQAQDADNPFGSAFADLTGPMSTSQAEGANNWDSMNMTIERSSVTAGSRQLRADWSLELTQDMKAVHGVDAESELSNILSTEITNEINREVVRRVYTVAKVGAQYTTVPGTYDLAADADGRWSVEKFKGLFFALEKEANQIAIDTRRGKGNLIICSANVASCLVLAGILDYAPATQALANLEIDVTGVTYAGTVGRHKVYIDPYVTFDGLCMGYKGATNYDAGFFYCPYVPLQMVRATNPMNFQPAIGFKTRYGMVANPFASADVNGATGAIVEKAGKGLGQGENQYYRKFMIANL